MGFDTSTFVLEIVNFLILTWILTHYFYRPVAAVIERRRSTIEARLLRAEQLQNSAEAMRQQYETRLAEWDAEKRRLREVWTSELATEKTRELDAFRQTLAAEQQRVEVLEQRRLRTRETELEQTALKLAGRFAEKLLERLASPALEACMIGLFTEELAGIPDEQWRLLAANGAETSLEGIVSSAFPLDERARTDLQNAVGARLGHAVVWRFVEDRELVAGLRLELGPLSLSANLRDELTLFNQSD